jgi:thioredoxin-related protein
VKRKNGMNVGDKSIRMRLFASWLFSIALVSFSSAASAQDGRRPIRQTDFDPSRSIIRQQPSIHGKLFAYTNVPEGGDGDIILGNAVPGAAHTGNGAIQFESGISWKDIQAKARAENKYIFMDCYATWCGPCKYMSEKIFTLPEVGEYFNTHFINVKVQIDETKSDSEEIRRWYPDAQSITKEYSIGSFPMYLFFAPDGRAVHRILGSAKTGDEFVAKAKDSLIPEQQYYTILSRYKESGADKEGLRHALEMALAASDATAAAMIADSYVKFLFPPFEKKDLQLVVQASNSSEGDGYRLLLKRTREIDRVLGEGVAENKLRSIVSEEEVDPLMSLLAPAADWGAIARRIDRKYPGQSGRMVAEAKPYYFILRRQWAEYEDAIGYYMEKYGRTLGDFETNNIAWGVFKYSDKKGLLLEALNWSRRTIAKYPNLDWANVDTYAQLSYKTGNRNDAVFWEKKAIAIVKDASQKKEFEDTLEKMSRGERTWPERPW